jgi:hypothetical protein
MPVPIPTCQCLRPPARRGGAGTRVTNRLLTHFIGVDHRATDPCCTDGSLGRTTGTKLGSAAASAYRVRGFAHPRAGFRSDQRSAASSWRSSARRHQCHGARGAHSACHCRYHRRYRAVQLGPRHRWNGFRNWRLIQHDAVGSRGREAWLRRWILVYCRHRFARNHSRSAFHARDETTDRTLRRRVASRPVTNT